jgi:hypothetical protein
MRGRGSAPEPNVLTSGTPVADPEPGPGPDYSVFITKYDNNNNDRGIAQSQVPNMEAGCNSEMPAAFHTCRHISISSEVRES